MNSKLGLVGLVLAAVCAMARAETVVHYRHGERVDPQEVAQILGGPRPLAIRTRSIRLLDAPAAAGASAAASVSTTATAAALSIPVQFKFDSAEIQDGMRTQLDQIAEGIKLLPPTQTVMVEGHTDATGTETYNLELSQRRAAAVKLYLVRVHGIEAARLQHAGFGEYRLIDGLDPRAPEHRRVQFRSGG